MTRLTFAVLALLISAFSALAETKAERCDDHNLHIELFGNNNPKTNKGAYNLEETRNACAAIKREECPNVPAVCKRKLKTEEEVRKAYEAARQPLKLTEEQQNKVMAGLKEKYCLVVMRGRPELTMERCEGQMRAAMSQCMADKYYISLCDLVERLSK